MATGMLYLNGSEAEATFGIIVTRFTGDLSMPARDVPLQVIPSLPGALDPGLAPMERPRTIGIEFLVQAASSTTLYATLDTIKEVCGTGTVEIITPYDTARACYGVLQSLEVAPQTASVLNGWATGTATFVCPNPYWIATSPTVVSFGSTATAIPLGTAPSAGRDTWSALIEIVGSATTPTLTYANSAGTTIGTMAFSLSPASGDSIVIDCGRRLVTKYVSGTGANALSYLTAGYTFPALDPADGSFLGSAWPTLKVSSGSATVTYYKAYR